MVFIVASAVAIVGFVLAWFLEERPLRETVAASAGLGEGFAMPSDAEPLTQISHGLSVLMRRDVQRQVLEQIRDRAGVDLTLPATWLLSQIDRCPGVPAEELARRFGINRERLELARRELRSHGLIVAGTPAPCDALTPAGHGVNERLMEVRRQHVAELVADWSPEEHRKVAEVLSRYAGDVEGDELSATPDDSAGS
jgi:DNA-binding MarR family transcriptional regulator